eukprot:497233-Pleurochrysis_carterae.AAC.1
MRIHSSSLRKLADALLDEFPFPTTVLSTHVPPSRGRGKGRDAAPANAAATQPSSAFAAAAAGSSGHGGRAAQAHA